MAKERSDTREDNANCDKKKKKYHLLSQVKFDYIFFSPGGRSWINVKLS